MLPFVARVILPSKASTEAVSTASLGVNENSSWLSLCVHVWPERTFKAFVTTSASFESAWDGVVKHAALLSAPRTRCPDITVNTL